MRSQLHRILLGLLVSSAVVAYGGERPIGLKRGGLLPAHTLEVPGIDPESLQQRDHALKAFEPAPLQIAEPEMVETDPLKSGQWDLLGDGRALWRQRVSAPGATDLNFGFTDFFLPEGAVLYLYSEEHEYAQGPYTAENNNEARQLWTAAVPGEEAVLELVVPEDRVGDVALELTSVNRGYRDLFNLQLDKQGACNIDVTCPEADPWRMQLRSVGAYTVQGIFTCSGTMIMNARRDYKPYFLTAEHCEVSSANAASVVVYWNYQSPQCGLLGGGDLSQNQSGAWARWQDIDTDGELIELFQMPTLAHNVFWSGWDRTERIPSAAVTIHHPGVEEKAISFQNNGLRATELGGTTHDTSADYWLIWDWDLGTTEPGSSGSGLWDASTQLLVGHLFGGSAACSNPLGSDWYGRLRNGSGLGSWIDPDGTGVSTVAGGQPGYDLPPVQIVTWGDATSYNHHLGFARSGIRDIEAYGDHLLSIKNGAVVGWGQFPSGGPAPYGHLPPELMSGVTQIAMGSSWMRVALKSGGAVGWSSHSGDPYGAAAVPAAAQSGVIKVAAGRDFALALKENGSVVAWGTGAQLLPYGLGGVIDIAAGAEVAYAIDLDRKLTAWGPAGACVTVPTEAATGVDRVVARNQYVAAIKRYTGKVVAWEECQWRTTPPYSTPPEAQSGVKDVAIESNTAEFLALKTDGSVIQWRTLDGGANWARESVPSGARSEIAAIAAGDDSFLALKDWSGLWREPDDIGATGWRFFDWFGWVNEGDNGWLYHAEHGWMWADKSQSYSSIWFYEADGLGWLWTSDTYYPWFWWWAGNTWLYYSEGTSNPRWFYNTNAGVWETH